MKCACYIVFTVCVGMASLADTRMAIIGDPQTVDISEMLTVSLANDGDIEWVEREEIRKILREKGQVNDVALGGLLDADGVIVIDAVADTKLISLRLTSVQDGMVLSGFLFAEPLKHIDELANRIRVQFLPLMRKLNKPVEARMYVSLAAFTSADPYSIPQTQARQVGVLMFHLLQRHPDVMVTERWRPDALAWEKSLRPLPQPLRSGQWIIKGELNRNEMNQIQLALRLTGDREPKTVEVTLGADEDTGQLVDKAWPLLLDVLQIDREDPLSGDRRLEASCYESEAEWALENGLYEEARAAAESCIALDSNTPRRVRARIRAYAGKGFPGYTQWMSLYKQPGARGDMASRMDDMTIALELLWQDVLCADTRYTGSYREDWRVFGSAVLLSASRFLRAYEASAIVEQSEGRHFLKIRNDQGAAYLRHLLRQNAQRIVQDGGLNGRSKYIYFLQAVYAPYWFEYPDEVLEAYRKVLNADFNNESTYITHRIRRHLFAWRDPASQDRSGPYETPLLIARHGESLSELAVLWNSFCESLMQSTSPVHYCDGLLARFAVQSNGKHDDPLQKTARRFMLDEQQAIVSRFRPKACYDLLAQRVNADYTFWVKFLAYALMYGRTDAPFTHDRNNRWIVDQMPSHASEWAAQLHSAVKQYRSRGDQDASLPMLHIDELEQQLLRQFPGLRTDAKASDDGLKPVFVKKCLPGPNGHLVFKHDVYQQDTAKLYLKYRDLIYLQRTPDMEWEPLNLPSYRYTDALILNGVLYAAYTYQQHTYAESGSGLIAYDLDKDTYSEVVGSRHMADGNPLNQRSPYVIEAMQTNGKYLFMVIYDPQESTEIIKWNPRTDKSRVLFKAPRPRRYHSYKCPDGFLLFNLMQSSLTIYFYDVIQEEMKLLVQCGPDPGNDAVWTAPEWMCSGRTQYSPHRIVYAKDNLFWLVQPCAETDFQYRLYIFSPCMDMRWLPLVFDLVPKNGPIDYLHADDSGLIFIQVFTDGWWLLPFVDFMGK